MTFEELKDKYKGEISQRKSSIAAAKTRIEFLKQLRRNCIQTREGFRSDGTPNFERSKNWTKYTRQISRLDEKIRAAEIELGKVCLGETGVNELFKNLKL